MRLILLVAACALARPAFGQDALACPLPSENDLFDLSLHWQEEDGASSRYTLQLAGVLYFSRYEGRHPLTDVTASTSATFYEVDDVEQLYRPLWTLAREVVCGVVFDRGSILYSFHSPKVELWVGFGDEALGARFLSAEAPAAAQELRRQLDALLLEYGD